jgi:RNA polymerase sigma-70 factor (ECF subfamily)
MTAAKSTARATLPETERALVEAAQRDPSCFAAIYDAHFERVYAYVVRRVRDRTEAEDVTADVFHHALKRLPRFEWRGVPVVAWLYRIAANMLIDRSKRAAHERGVPAPAEPAATGPDDVERGAQLFRLVDRLPTAQRDVVRMRFAEEKTIREIAAAIGRSEGAVKQLQLRALQRLRAHMEESDG